MGALCDRARRSVRRGVRPCLALPRFIDSIICMEGICWRRPAVHRVLTLCVGAWWVVMAAFGFGWVLGSAGFRLCLIWLGWCHGLFGRWLVCLLIGLSVDWLVFWRIGFVWMACGLAWLVIGRLLF